MHRRTLFKAAAAIASTLSAPAIAQGNAKVLRCAPEANLASIDPIWTTATVAINHARESSGISLAARSRFEGRETLAVGASQAP